MFGTGAYASPVHAGKSYQLKDTIPLPADSMPFQDSLKYPIADRRGDQLSSTRLRGFDLKDPDNITDSVIYDPKEKKY